MKTGVILSREDGEGPRTDLHQWISGLPRYDVLRRFAAAATQDDTRGHSPARRRPENSVRVVTRAHDAARGAGARDDHIVRVMKSRWPIAISLIVAAAAFAFLTAGRIGENLVYYWSPSDLIRAGDKAYGASIRLGGMVASGSLVAAPASADVRFDVTDGSTTVRVRTHGVPPQMFREGIGVVVEGTMTRDGWFDGRRLMVSHNNNYRAPKNHQRMNAEELIRSTKGVSE